MWLQQVPDNEEEPAACGHFPLEGTSQNVITEIRLPLFVRHPVRGHPPCPPLDNSISQQPEDGLLAIFREGGPCLQEAIEPRVLHASGDGIGDTLAITARNRLC